MNERDTNFHMNAESRKPQKGTKQKYLQFVLPHGLSHDAGLTLDFEGLSAN